MCGTICVWGDSIAKGIVFDEERGRYAILRENCLRLLETELHVPVRNYAVMGRTAPECLAAADPDDRVKGGIAVIEFGGNDSDMDWAAVAREPLKDHPARSMLVTPIPIDGEKYFRWVSRGLDGGAILTYLGGDAHMMYRWQEQYADAVRDVAREENVRLLDFRGDLLRDRQFGQLYCRDGIHLNARGHRKLFDCARRILEEDKAC